MARISKTVQKIQTFFDKHRNYKEIEKKTGIDKKRLSAIRRGKEKANPSEIQLIRYFKPDEKVKKAGDEVGLKDIKKSTGFSFEAISKAIKAGRLTITKKYLEDDNSYLLKSKGDDPNYHLSMEIYVNLQKKHTEIGLSKHFTFKHDSTATIYDPYYGNKNELYSFRIIVFRLHQYTNLKQQIEKAIDKILNTDGDIERDAEIEVLLHLVNYDGM